MQFLCELIDIFIVVDNHEQVQIYIETAFL